MSEHIVSKKIYFGVWGILMVGTILTYLVALRDMDHVLFAGANTVIALTIAFFKASFVVLFFMHVRYSSKLIAVFVLSGIFWLGVMFLLTMSDFTTRPHVVVDHPPSVTSTAPTTEGGETSTGSEKITPAPETSK
jgi:cytochrome c oxidase subunit 4